MSSLKKQKNSIFCIGQCVIDVLATGLNPGEVHVDVSPVKSISLMTGGDALNPAKVLGRLGNDVYLAAKVGDDYQGKIVIEDVKTPNVHTDAIKVAKGLKTSTCIVAIRDDGERLFYYFGGTNDNLCKEDIDMTYMDECSIVYFAGVFCIPALDGQDTTDILKIAKQKGKTTVMDVNTDVTGRWMEIIESNLEYIDYFIPSFAGAEKLTGKSTPQEMADEFLRRGVKTAGIKLGDKGVYIKNSEQEFIMPAFKVKTVDTTGAGDSFMAGFITGLQKGWALEECARFACAVGAQCVQSVGATIGVGSFDDVMDFLASQDKG